MNAKQKYEFIRPILKGEKTPKQASEETGVPLSNIYYYLKRFREGGEDMESLTDKSHASHSHPEWLTQEDKEKIVQYKLQHPHISSRMMAKELTREGILKIHDRTVANILRERAA